MRRHLGQRVGVERREQAGIVDQRHGRRVLGQEHVGRRSRAFLHDLVAEFGVAALAQRDLDAGFLGEAVGPFLGQALVLRVVDDNAFGASWAIAGPAIRLAENAMAPTMGKRADFMRRSWLR